MPTAEAFDAAARSFDRVADQLGQLMHDTTWYFGPDTLRGGMLTIVADLTIATAQVTATTAAASAASSARICRERAAACRAFAADMADYHRRLAIHEQAWSEYDPTDPFGAPPARPERPRPAASYIDI